jgi:pimeloyl-ACP methyl ester carboxylesterase
LILESTFTSVASFAWGVGGIPWIVKHPYRTDAALRDYTGSVLIFHGAEDDIIPVSHGRALHRMLPASTYIETKGDHINYPPDAKAFWAEIDRFMGANQENR